MKTINLHPREIHALDSVHRRKILNLLKKEMNVEELQRHMTIATTTIRHHLDILVKSRLVQKTRMVEKAGAHIKFYKANTKLGRYDLS